MESFKSSSPKSEDEPLLDHLFETFLGSINSVIGYGDLVRSRRAVLMNWKVQKEMELGAAMEKLEECQESLYRILVYFLICYYLAYYGVIGDYAYNKSHNNLWWRVFLNVGKMPY
ncbi:hypothetical protein POM88_003621 [Heracleum sosnowskyi]|uniref:Uncharacterized protein n=1 Tax=Heracleum sosnowskyi TaxID=360622 RepID=A0AAD8JHZ8_9APIA|nr:hypothetical protein POM88_003621 [Heracleum sosnowskyi]